MVSSRDTCSEPSGTPEKTSFFSSLQSLWQVLLFQYKIFDPIHFQSKTNLFGSYAMKFRFQWGNTRQKVFKLYHNSILWLRDKGFDLIMWQNFKGSFRARCRRLRHDINAWIKHFQDKKKSLPSKETKISALHYEGIEIWKLRHNSDRCTSPTRCDAFLLFLFLGKRTKESRDVCRWQHNKTSLTQLNNDTRLHVESRMIQKRERS